MSNFLIHIGMPRTGTTVLQKWAFPKCKNHLVFMKRAYALSGTSINKERPFLVGAKPNELLHRLTEADPKKNPTDFFNSFIATPSILASQEQSSREGAQLCSLILAKALEKISNAGSEAKKSILISSERLIDTGASLVCKSSHGKSDYNFGYIKICESIAMHLSITPLILVCIREPIGYLRSKYMRTFIQRRAMQSHRDLSPSEYIEKQVILENKYPGTSVLIHTMHTHLIKQLQRHAFVKAYGFEELLASDDIFSLMGLKGEGAYAFQDFPRENKLPFSKEQEHKIEIEIIQTLKKYGFYDRIMGTQIYA